MDKITLNPSMKVELPSFICPICEADVEGKYAVTFTMDETRVIAKFCFECYAKGMLWAACKAKEEGPKFMPMKGLY